VAAPATLTSTMPGGLLGSRMCSCCPDAVVTGHRREFRSYLAGAGLDGQALVERELPRRWLLNRWLARRIGPEA
jgi:hypothetical protein